MTNKLPDSAPLQKTLDAIRQGQQALASFTTTAADLTAEVDSLIRSGNDDKTTIADITQLRTRLELLPHRVKRQEEELSALAHQFLGQIEAFEEGICRAASDEKEALALTIENALKPYAPNCVRHGEVINRAKEAALNLPVMQCFPTDRDKIAAPFITNRADPERAFPSMVNRADALAAYAKEVAARGSFVPKDYGKA